MGLHFFRRGAHAERLVWSRDERLVHRLAARVPGSRTFSLAIGAVLVGPATQLGEAAVAALAGDAPFGLVTLDSQRAEPERTLAAFAEAVQQSGIADRVGMITSPTVGFHKIVDTFLARREVVEVHYQPIASLATFRLFGYEALCRPSRLVGSITQLVEAAIASGRTLDLDRLMADKILEQTAALRDRLPHVTINVLPASLADPWFEPAAFAAHCRSLGVPPSVVTLECTEQQTAPDVQELARRVQRLRRQGFGFAIDDAGAGYASFALIAALRPSVIKIDAQIVRGLANADAKQALVEAFVGFARRIGATLVAEGIERRSDLDTLRRLGVEYGQGFLLGPPAPQPHPARRHRRRARAPRESVPLARERPAPSTPALRAPIPADPGAGGAPRPRTPVRTRLGGTDGVLATAPLAGAAELRAD